MRLSKGDIVVNKAVALGTNNTLELPENNHFAKLESSEIETVHIVPTLDVV